MFNFADMPVKFVGLLLMFVWCTAWSIYELTRRQDGRQRVSNVLHLAMSVVMLLMVAPMTWKALTAVVPTFVLAGLFALATLWFGWLALRAGRGSDRRGLLHFVGHTIMFAAMTWHLAAMGVMHAVKMAAMGSGSGQMGGHGEHGGHSTSSAGGSMTTGDWMTTAREPGGVLWLFALIGVPLMAYLFIAGSRALVLVFPGSQTRPTALVPATSGSPVVGDTLTGTSGATTATLVHQTVETSQGCHEERPAGSLAYRLEQLASFAMNIAMFWMSTGIMVPLLPVFTALSF